MADRVFSIPALDVELDPASLERRFQELAGEEVAKGLMDQALAKVASWSWTYEDDGGGERVEPFWRERHRLGPRVKEQPGRAPIDQVRPEIDMYASGIPKWMTMREFGRDRDGRLVVSRLVSGDRRWAGHVARDPSAAEVWISGTESVRMSPSATWVSSVRRTSWVDGRIVASASYEPSDGAQWHGEYYGYVDGALDSIRAWAMRGDAGAWSVWPHPTPLRFWTVERNGRSLRERPVGGSMAPQLSDLELDVLERDYLTCATGALADLAEVAWRSSREWLTEHGAADSRHPVCLISLPPTISGLPALSLINVLTEQERAQMQRRRSYKPLDAYLKAEGSGVGAADFTDQLQQARSLGEQLSDELHRRRDDERIADVLATVLRRLRDHDWTDRLPITDDLVVACIDPEASKRARRAQLERSIGAERVAALEHAEKRILAASRATAVPAIKLSRAKRELLKAIGTDVPPGTGGVAHLWAAFSRFVSVPIEDCEPETDGDMILIEWGTCHGAFQLSFVRQLSPDNDQRDGMYTVTLQTTFPGDPRLAAVRDGNAWLNPTDPEFASTAQSLEGCEAVLAIAPTKWEVHAGRV